MPPTAQPERSHPLIGARVARLLEHDLFPVVLGGDHSITFPVLKAFGGRPLHLVQFDTHMDYWNDEGGMRFTHASPIVRSHESGVVQRVTQYGIRGLHTAADQIELAAERGVTTFWCEQAKATAVDELVAHIAPGEDVYITFDIDCLDPSIAPGTGTPEPAASATTKPKPCCERSRCGRTSSAWTWSRSTLFTTPWRSQRCTPCVSSSTRSAPPCASRAA